MLNTAWLRFDELRDQVAAMATCSMQDRGFVLSARAVELLAREIACWLEIGRRENNIEECESAKTIVTLPLSLNQQAILATAALDECAPQLIRLEKIGEGSFILGEDNAVFGRWNALIAHNPSGALIDIFPGHGGEIIPGQLQDHVDRLRRNLEEGVRLPTQVDIDASMACASNCVFCFSADYRASRERNLLMDRDLLFDLLRQWAELGVQVARFDGGGDPLTYPYLLDAIRLARGLGMRTAVLTSGDLLHERQFATFIDCRTYIRVSLNAGRDETRELLHRPKHPSYTLLRVLKQMDRLADARREALPRDARHEMLLGATCLIHPHNVRELYEVAHVTKEAGFDHLSFRVVLGEQHAVSFAPELKVVLSQEFARIRTELVDDTFQVFFPHRSLTDAGYCPADHFTTCLACTHRALLEVGHRADTIAMVPCGRYRGHGFRWSTEAADRLTVFARIGRGQSLQDVWMAPPMRDLAAKFPHACRDCIDRSANLFFSRIEAALATHRDARFLRLHTARWE